MVKKIFTQKTTPYVMAFFMALTMSCVMSLTMTLAARGISLEALHSWPFNWLRGFLVGYPTALIVTPIARRATKRIIKD